MLQYSKECLGFIALILTTYATLLNKEPVVGETGNPILAPDSIVHELYGNLFDVESKIASSELALIYLYAPWCAESLIAKKVYSSVAHSYSEQAYFVAVNCWQPNSGCRSLYFNVHKWPVLMAYLPNALSVQYNGDWNFHSLVKFIDGLLTPIVRIHNLKELLHLRIANDAVVFGAFKSCDTREFQIFFQTAIKWLDNNSFQNTVFSVFVGEDPSVFSHLEHIESPVIKLFTPNNTIAYGKSKWTSVNITKFLRDQLTDSSIWVNLPSIKSSIIHKYLERGPVLLMFSPRVSQSNHYFIMKQMIYSYNNYHIDLNNSVLDEYIFNVKKENPVMFKKLKHACNFQKKVQHLGFQKALFGENVWDEQVLFTISSHPTNTTNQMFSTYFPHIEVNINECCQQNLNKLDYQAPSEIFKSYIHKQCANLEKSAKTMFQKAIVEPIGSIELPTSKNIYNRTLTFLMLDAMLYNDFLRYFIGDHTNQVFSTSSSSKLLIIDNGKETLHMQKKKISTANVMEFLDDFNSGRLSRYLRSSRYVENNKKYSTKLLIRIKEINSRQFLKVINRINVTSVVLFYTPQCSLCYTMSQKLLHTSNIIKLNTVKFYRIDASINEVCWEYTMDKFPVLIIFPKKGVGDTSIFPSTQQISVKNVFSFIISKLNAYQKVNSLINACVLTKLVFAFQNCVQRVRGMISNEISQQLQSWDHPVINRTQVLTRLKELKAIYFELFRARKAEDLKCLLKDIVKYEHLN